MRIPRTIQQRCLPARIEPRTCSWWCLFLCFPISSHYSSAILLESLAALRQCLRTLNDVLYTTGVGSLPLLPPDATEPSTEDQLAEQANKAISTLFTLHTRMQETAAVAASVMARTGTSTMKLEGTAQVSFNRCIIVSSTRLRDQLRVSRVRLYSQIQYHKEHDCANLRHTSLLNANLTSIPHFDSFAATCWACTSDAGDGLSSV